MLALPEHLRDALWRVESAIMNEWDTPGGLVVAGMGGSAIGGAWRRAALGDHASRPIFVTRAYGLPPWTTPETTVLCASYSGNTEETLACYESAGALGAQRVVVTTGGRLAELARADKCAGDPAARRLSAARRGRLHDGGRAGGRRPLRGRPAVDLGDRRRRRPRRAARRRVGPRRAGGVAREGRSRAVCRARAGDRRRRADRPDRLPLEDPDQRERQAPCFASELPELDHNEIVGWEGAPRGSGRFAAVFLDDFDAHPRVKERMELTERLIADSAAATSDRRHAGRPRSSGSSRWCCSAASSRSAWRPCAGSIRDP